MAGWTTLSNSIKSIIKSNNNQEINGSNLQSVLLSIVNSLGDNAQFVDIATPETNPGYPDYNVFYLATEPGTYSNFGGLTVNKDEVVIFKNHISDKTWKKKAINLISIYSMVSFNRHVFTNSSEANRFIKELYVPNKEFSYLQGKTCSIDIQKASLHQSNGKYYNLFRFRIDGEDIGPDSNLVLVSGSYETKEEAEAAINVGVNHTNLYSKDVYSVINWDAMETDSATIYNVVVNTLMWNLAMSPAIEYSISGVKESTEAANAAAQAALEAANATSNALSSINAATTVANNAKASADVAASSAVEATTKANNAAKAANNAAAEAAKATLAAEEATSSANELSNSLSERVTNVESGIEGAASIANSAMTEVDNVSSELSTVKEDVIVAKTNSEQSLEKSNEAIQKVEENTNSITGISQKISGNINYEDLSESARQQIESAGGGSIVNNADDEDLEVFVNSGDKSVIRRKTIKQYVPSQKTGLGYVILRRNKSFIEQVIYSNTIYEIGYDFDLGGETASIPANCILKFTGGSIDNGVLSSADSRGFIVKAEEYQIFGNLLTFDVNVSRTCIINKEVYAKWFGDMSETADSAIAIRRAIAAVDGNSRFPFSHYPTIYLPATTIYLSSTVEIDSYGVIIDGRHERKNGLSPYIIPNVPNLTCFQVTGYCDCSFKNMLIRCPESDETGVLRTFVAFDFIQAEHLYLDNCEVANAKIGFYFSGTQNGINLALLNKISCTKSLYGVWINYGGDAAWKNGIEIVPWNISKNDINIRIDKGAVTTIRGGSAEIGGASENNTNLPSYISHNYGIYVTGNSVVNVIGCLWLENLYYTIYAKDNSIVNVYGETWALSNFMKEDNANINIVGSNSQTVSLETGDLWRILKDKCGLFLDSNFLKSRDSTPGLNYNPTVYELLNIKNFPEVEEPAECTAYTVNIGNKTFISSVNNYIPNSHIGTRKITCFIKQRIGAASFPIRFTTSSGKTLQIGLTSFTENSYNPPSVENNPDVPVVPCIEATLQIYYDSKFLQNSKLCRFFTKNSMASMKGGYFDLIIGISFDLDTYETMIINADGTSYIVSNYHSMDIPQDEQIYINNLSIVVAYSSAKETGFEKIITFKDHLNSYEIDYVINRCLKENIFNTGNYTTTFKNFERFNPKVVSIPKTDSNPSALLQTINIEEDNKTQLHGFIQTNSVSDLSATLKSYGGTDNIDSNNLLVFNRDSHRLSLFSKLNRSGEFMITNVILEARTSFSDGEYINSVYNKNGTVVFFTDLNIKAYVYNGAVYDFNGNRIRGTDYRKSGISSQRPTLSLTVGQMYFDITLKKPIWYDGTAWVDSTGVYV